MLELRSPNLPVRIFAFFVARLASLMIGLGAGITTWTTGVAAQEPFTLEQVLSAPFPSGLVAAPSGGAVAWVQNAEGIRNVWFAAPPNYEGRPLTAYTEDDGQQIGNLAFTPDEERILYARGGDPNRQGELPNPLSRSAGIEQALWIVSVSGGEPQKLGEGDAPAISPAGDRVAFLHRGQVWSVSLAEDEAPEAGEPDTAAEEGAEPDERDAAEETTEPHAAEEGPEPELLFTLRGRPRSLRWSPDGARLAFVSARDDHSFVGVFDLSAETITWLDPSLDRDGEPVWSPDATRIAFLRIPNEGQRLPFSPRREALPWSLRVADAGSGEGREVWRANPGPGSAFRGLEAERQLLWGDGDLIVFPWEREGWVHLYAVPVAGGAATELTPGEFFVEHWAVTPDRREVVYSSNQADIDRRHVWRVRVDGRREPRPVTSGDGIEWSPVVTSDGEAVALFASDARRAAHAVIVDGRGARPLAPSSMPEDFPLAQLVIPQQVVFPASDGMPIHGQLFLPPGARPGERHPAVLFFHGGSRRQMLLGWHYRGYYHNAYALNQYLASRGYVVLSVNYRSGIGYGLEFREALNYGARGASEFQDVMGAGLYLRSRPDVDPARIGLWGGSYGGYLTALGLARASDLFAAGVDLHGVHDWNAVIRNFVPSYDPAEREAAARLAFESSPMAFVDGWQSPVLLIHGDDDRNVPFSESVDLAEALRNRGVQVESLVFPDEVHGFLLHRSWLAAYRAAADFFDRTLGDGAATASTGGGG